ncbi:PREDICTED: uncharacterized protein LOC108559470 [Nicrophorus vespilloides]|uniref:Uncharacterized protein LOC108559470 n=1 Tax=Nicrophorus vespilloides TaxID=110193 RepID=A0ABM1MCG5_NICVS|nr:PREDICTED: uncharacterized protein LOC108559470 [Nicrophorus vespilloides]
MKHIFTFVCAVLLAAAQVTVAVEHCDSLGTLCYDDLGCTPVLGSDGCPSSYDCSQFSTAPDSCSFHGNVFNSGERILGTSGCNTHCICGGNGTTICPIVDCYHGPKINKECYNTYKLHGCCSTGEKCPPFGGLSTCTVDGETYREGEYFRPEGTCKACVCGTGFTGAFVEPFCETIKCDVELKANKIAENCAPAYRKNTDALCCPSYYVCQSESTVVSEVPSGVTTGKFSFKR